MMLSLLFYLQNFFNVARGWVLLGTSPIGHMHSPHAFG